MKDPERIFEMDFLRATESAALMAHRWMGRGEKELADADACARIVIHMANRHEAESLEELLTATRQALKPLNV